MADGRGYGREEVESEGDTVTILAYMILAIAFVTYVGISAWVVFS